MTVDIGRGGQLDGFHWTLANLDLQPIEHECVRDDWLTYIWSRVPPLSRRQPNLYARDLVLHFLDPLARDGLSKRWQPEELQHGRALPPTRRRRGPAWTGKKVTPASSRNIPDCARWSSWRRAGRSKWLRGAWSRLGPRPSTPLRMPARASRCSNNSPVSSAATRCEIYQLFRDNHFAAFMSEVRKRLRPRYPCRMAVQAVLQPLDLNRALQKIAVPSLVRAARRLVFT